MKTTSYLLITFFILLLSLAPLEALAKKNSLNDYKRKHFNMYSSNDDVQLGEHYMKEQIKEFKKTGVGVDKNKTLKIRIEKIVKKITAVSDNPNFPYEVHIFDRPDVVNAFCMPGGKIGVFTGLFDKEKGLVNINSDDEIAAVLAHEIAHATMRHVTRRMTTMQGFNIFGAVVSTGVGAGLGESAQQIFGNAFSLGANLYMPSYSRKYESEADRVGFYYMSRAKFDPQAAIDLWKRAAAKGGPNSKTTDFFASHPANGERAKALQKWLIEAEKISGN